MPHRLVAQRLSRVFLETSFCEQIDPRLIPVEVGTHQENIPCRHGMRDDKPQFVVFVEPRVNVGSIKRIAILVHDDLLARPVSFGRGRVPVNDGPLIDRQIHHHIPFVTAVVGNGHFRCRSPCDGLCRLFVALPAAARPVFVGRFVEELRFADTRQIDVAVTSRMCAVHIYQPVFLQIGDLREIAVGIPFDARTGPCGPIIIRVNDFAVIHRPIIVITRRGPVVDTHVVQVLTGADRNASRRNTGHFVFRTIGILPGFGPGDDDLLYGIAVHQHPRIIKSVRQVTIRRECDGV